MAHDGSVVRRSSKSPREPRSKALLGLLAVAAFTWAWARGGAGGEEGRAALQPAPSRVLPSPPPTASRSIAPPRFPHAAESALLKVFADVDQPVADLLEFGEGTLRELRSWLGAPPRAKSYSVYLCGEVETMLRLEEANGLPRSDPSPLRTFDYRGGFYPDLDLILLACEPGADMRWDVAHELGHAAFRERVGRSCDAIDEGLANYAAARALGRAQGPFRMEAVARALQQGTLPTLERFFALDYWEFRDEDTEERYFDLSWLLVRLLVEDGSDELGGRFPLLLDALAARWDPWTALSRTYDVARLEQAWMARIEDASRWVPVFGEWSRAGEAFEVVLRDEGSAILAFRDAPLFQEAFSLRARLATALGPKSELGFVFALVHGEQYHALILRPSTEELVVAARSNGRWDASTFVPVPDPPPDWTAEELRLDCSATGEAVLSFGERVLVRHTLGPDAFRGRVGLFVYPRDEARDADGARRVRYVLAEASWGR